MAHIYTPLRDYETLRINLCTNDNGQLKKEPISPPRTKAAKHEIITLDVLTGAVISLEYKLKGDVAETKVDQSPIEEFYIVGSYGLAAEYDRLYTMSRLGLEKPGLAPQRA